jgi:hypothetical protein
MNHKHGHPNFLKEMTTSSVGAFLGKEEEGKQPSYNTFNTQSSTTQPSVWDPPGDDDIWDPNVVDMFDPTTWPDNVDDYGEWFDGVYGTLEDHQAQEAFTELLQSVNSISGLGGQFGSFNRRMWYYFWAEWFQLDVDVNEPGLPGQP